MLVIVTPNIFGVTIGFILGGKALSLNQVVLELESKGVRKGNIYWRIEGKQRLQMCMGQVCWVCVVSIRSVSVNIVCICDEVIVGFMIVLVKKAIIGTRRLIRFEFPIIGERLLFLSRYNKAIYCWVHVVLAS